MHRLHIDDDIWKWYMKNHSASILNKIIVFTPTGKRYEINPYDLLRLKGFKGTDFEIRDLFEIFSVSHREGSIKPSDVKEYILYNLKNQNEDWTLCRS